MTEDNPWGITEENRCKCSRSPTGKCIGWHSLSNEDYAIKLQEYNNQQLNESAPQLLKG